ncbi:MAG: hypothetical protein LBN26_04255 [Christensenellaceae bacterium]|jgi:pyocin large subunit-like protein|nr:hypothetical protein [Christensenellaceae bacterium]
MKRNNGRLPLPLAILAAILLGIVIIAAQRFLYAEPDTAPAPEIAPAAAETAGETKEAPGLPALDLDYVEDTWGNPQTLQDHFDRHGADFDAATPQEYAALAHALYTARAGFQTKVDENGVTRVFDPGTGAFGAYNTDGTTKTFFKPDDGQAYFDRQPGK